MINNAGFQNLKGLIEHLGFAGCGSAIFEHWYSRRWPQVEDKLNSFGKKAEVNDFINAYAASLAKSISALLHEGSLSETAEAAIDFAEELHSQAEFFIEEHMKDVTQTSVPDRCPVLPCVNIPPRYALAA